VVQVALETMTIDPDLSERTPQVSISNSVAGVSIAPPRMDSVVNRRHAV
jgi:hypothetical protein